MPMHAPRRGPGHPPIPDPRTLDYHIDRPEVVAGADDAESRYAAARQALADYLEHLPTAERGRRAVREALQRLNAEADVAYEAGDLSAAYDRRTEATQLADAFLTYTAWRGRERKRAWLAGNAKGVRP